MVSPVSNDRITAQTNSQGRTAAQENNTKTPATTPEAQQKAQPSNPVQVNGAGKLINQAETRSSEVQQIDSYEQALATAESLRQSFANNGSEALSAHGLQADQLAGLLQSA